VGAAAPGYAESASRIHDWPKQCFFVATFRTCPSSKVELGGQTAGSPLNRACLKG